MTLNDLFKIQSQPEKSENTVQEQAGNATNFYNNQFENELQKMIFGVYENMEKCGKSFDYINGTLNGLQLVVDYFQRQIGITKNKE